MLTQNESIRYFLCLLRKPKTKVYGTFSACYAHLKLNILYSSFPCPARMGFTPPQNLRRRIVEIFKGFYLWLSLTQTEKQDLSLEQIKGTPSKHRTFNKLDFSNITLCNTVAVGIADCGFCCFKVLPHSRNKAVDFGIFLLRSAIPQAVHNALKTLSP